MTDTAFWERPAWAEEGRNNLRDPGAAEPFWMRDPAPIPRPVLPPPAPKPAPPPFVVGMPLKKTDPRLFAVLTHYLGHEPYARVYANRYHPSENLLFSWVDERGVRKTLQLAIHVIEDIEEALRYGRTEYMGPGSKRRGTRSGGLRRSVIDPSDFDWGD